MTTLLEAKNLKVFFPITGGVLQRVRGYIKAVNGIDVDVQEGEIVSIVGESGCGKSTLGFSILGLTPVTSGEISLLKNRLDTKKPSSWKPFRKSFQIIFQDPFTSLNPRHTIFRILSEPLLKYNICSNKEAKDGVARLLEQVGLSPDLMQQFPYTFSGGQRQRIAIARSIGISPKLIICDEVVSALDVSVQAQIIQLLIDLKKRLGLSLLFITHDLSLVKVISDRVYVMYLGKILETRETNPLFSKPQHPYTEALLNSIPTTDRSIRPQILEGEVPSPLNLPQGCIFRSRCKYSREICKERHPDLIPSNSGQTACFFPLNR
ncbi:MAG: ATP-binding cassette domain-containing protein [Deltaproteobacteria bacterium]|nr:ATP-binding cassette domain-containing protein [Deltaproteobacteria bacterium]